MRSVSEISHDAGRASGLARRRFAKHRQGLILALHVAGLTQKEIAEKIGVSSRTVLRDLAEIEDVQVRVDELIEDAGLDADDIHLTLSKMHDADLSDIVENPDDPIDELRYKPIAQWPKIWRQGLAGKVKITPVTLPDGKQTKGGDPTGYKIEIERESLLKILELSSKLKQVDALVKPDVPGVNVVVITAERARQVAGAKKRLAKVIDIPKPDEI